MVAVDGKSMTAKLKKLIFLLEKYDGIEYNAKAKGTAGKIHTFINNNNNDNEWIIIPEQEEMDNVFG